MTRSLIAICALLVSLDAAPARADDILDAIDQARKAYQAGDMTTAKQSIDTASQLIAQKNAESYAAALPQPLPGWTAEKVETNAVGAAMFGGGAVAKRTYTNAKGETIDISISGDSALLMQFAPMLANPAMAGALGKLIRIGGQSAVQTPDGDVLMLVANKFLVNVQGGGAAADKMSYVQAIDIAKLSKM